MTLFPPRTRDCVVAQKGDGIPVGIPPLMQATGWQGGVGLCWGPSVLDEFAVTLSDGLYGGFALWGSLEPADQLTGMTGSQATYGFLTMGVGTWLISTRTFETHTWLSRQGGPLVPLVYRPGDKLRYSLRGYWTKEDEWTLSGDLRAPNTYFVGTVMQSPSLLTEGYLSIQTSILAMPETLRSRDCVLFFPGDIIPVEVAPSLLASGWPGGVGVMWADSPGQDRRIVQASDSRYGGFLLWGSNETADQYTAMTGQFLKYGFAVMAFGGNLMATSTYERYTYASRLAPPLVPLVYGYNDPLYFSLRGYWTKEDEATLSGSPLAPASAFGFVAQPPRPSNREWLGIFTTL